MISNIINTLILVLVTAAFASQSVAQSRGGGLGVNEAVVSVKELPKKNVQDELVFLNVKHIRQKPGCCVPTSCAMILRYLGESANPGSLKKLAENHKPADQRNKEFTYWKDMLFALKKKGHNWNVERFEKTDAGFEKGLDKIKECLRNELPVMIEVHLDAGHSFVVMGFDDEQQQVFIRDPWIASNQARILSYQKLKDCWHNHKYSKSRSVLIPVKPPST